MPPGCALTAPTARTAAQSLQRPLGAITGKMLITSLLCSPTPSLLLPDKQLSAQLAFLLHLLIQQLQRSELQRALRPILPRKGPRVRRQTAGEGGMEATSLYVPNGDPDITRTSDEFFPNKGQWKMGESIGSGIKRTAVRIPDWPFTSCVT